MDYNMFNKDRETRVDPNSRGNKERPRSARVLGTIQRPMMPFELLKIPNPGLQPRDRNEWHRGPGRRSNGLRRRGNKVRLHV